ncbi:MAG: response regulator transcription factor [Desulfatitalea sp.]
MASDTLLLVDDDVELCNLLKEFLIDEGFHVEACHNGNEGVAKACAGTYALIILDVMLPGCNGFEALQRIRKQSEVPVLMLTARGDEVDRIVGLEIGADDYLAKPFNPRELIARIRAVLRRTRNAAPRLAAGSEKKRLRVGDLEMDIAARRVVQHGKEIDLTAVEFTLLKVLLLSAGNVVSREELNRAVLGRDYSPLDRSIDVHISKLRKKVKGESGAADAIKAIRGEGYVFAVSED